MVRFNDHSRFFLSFPSSAFLFVYSLVEMITFLKLFQKKVKNGTSTSKNLKIVRDISVIFTAVLSVIILAYTILYETLIDNYYKENYYTYVLFLENFVYVVPRIAVLVLSDKIQNFNFR